MESICIWKNGNAKKNSFWISPLDGICQFAVWWIDSREWKLADHTSVQWSKGLNQRESFSVKQKLSWRGTSSLVHGHLDLLKLHEKISYYRNLKRFNCSKIPTMLQAMVKRGLNHRKSFSAINLSWRGSGSLVRGHLDLLKLLLTAAHGRNRRQKAPRAAAAHRSVALLVHTAGRHRWRGEAPLRGGSAGGAMAWRGTLRRRKGFGGATSAYRAPPVAPLRGTVGASGATGGTLARHCRRRRWRHSSSL